MFVSPLSYSPFLGFLIDIHLVDCQRNGGGCSLQPSVQFYNDNKIRLLTKLQKKV